MRCPRFRSTPDISEFARNSYRDSCTNPLTWKCRKRLQLRDSIVERPVDDERLDLIARKLEERKLALGQKASPTPRPKV
jgi:hypothetical protein